MSFFTRRPQPTPAEPKPVATPPQMSQLSPAKSRADILMGYLREYLRDIPTSAIIAEWADHPNPDVYPTRCPSAVAEAFFMYPCDGAVDFFERYFFPIDKFAADFDPEVLGFVARCKTRSLSVSVQHSVEQFGIKETLARIAGGLDDNPLLASQILELNIEE